MTDRDAVREALVNVIGACDQFGIGMVVEPLATALGLPTSADKRDIADALLGRAQQGEAEPVAVTQQMVDAAIQANAEWWATPGEVSPDARYRYILTAALNAGPNPKEGE